MSLSLLRLTLASKITKEIFADNEALLVQEHYDYHREAQKSRERDMKSRASILLPLGGTKKHCTSQLWQWLQRLQIPHTALQSDPVLILSICSFAAITVPKMLLSQAVSTTNLHVQLFLELFWTGVSAYIVLVWHGQGQVLQSLQSFTNAFLLLLVPYFEIRAFLGGIREEPSFGTFELTAYLVVATVVACAQKEYIRAKRLEEDLLHSQGVVNRVASEVLSEPTLQAGLAILHLEASEDRINILRYNKSFLVHLRLNSSAQQPQDNPALERQAVARYLESIQLCARQQESDVTNYKAALQRAVRERVICSDSDLNGNAPDLFTSDFFDPEKAIRNENQAPASGHRQRSIREDGYLQIRTRVLSDKNKLYLLRVERFSPCRLQAQNSIVQLMIEPVLVQPNGSRRVSMINTLAAPRNRANPKRTESHKNLRPRRANGSDLTHQLFSSKTMPVKQTLSSIKSRSTENCELKEKKDGAESIIDMQLDSFSQNCNNPFGTAKKSKQNNICEISNQSLSRSPSLPEFKLEGKLRVHRKNLLKKSFRSVKELLVPDEQAVVMQGTNYSSSDLRQCDQLSMSKSNKSEVIIPFRFQTRQQSSQNPSNVNQFYFSSDNNGSKSKSKSKLGISSNTYSLENKKRAQSGNFTSLIYPSNSGVLLQSVSNSQTKKQLSSRGGGNKQFMFKIIHDLRHPTQSFKDGLQRIIGKADSFKRSSSQVFCSEYRYFEDQRARKATRVLKNFTKQFGMKSSKANSGKYQSIGLLDQKHSRSLSFKHKNSLRDLNLENQNSIKQVQQLRDCFWNLPLENFEDKGSPLLRKQPSLKEQNQEIKVKRDESLLINQSESNQSINNSASVSEDSSIDQDEIQESTPNQVMFENPKKAKVLARSSQEIVQVVDKLRLESRSSYITNSLAVDSLLFESPIAKRLNVQDDKALKNGEFVLRPLSNPTPRISNVLQTLQSIKEKDNMRHFSSDSKAHQQLPLSQRKNISEVAPRSDKIKPPQIINNMLEPLQPLALPQAGYNSLEELSANSSALMVDKAASSISMHGEPAPLSQPELAKFVHVLLCERRKLIMLTEDHNKKRLGIKKQSQEMLGYVEQMSLLLNDLMNLAMFGSNTFKLVNDYFNCKNLIRRCFKSLRVQSRAKDVRLEGPIFENPLDRIYFKAIYGDESRYGQIITNFLTNGIKFTPRKGVVSVILRVIDAQNLQAEEVKEEIAIDDISSMESIPDKGVGSNSLPESSITQLITFQMVFRDSGCGISEENQEKLFSNFSKLDDSQELNKQGVGLGLSICREIINANGGSVSIESAMGKGTDFIISLQAKCKIDPEQVNQQELSQRSKNSTISLLNSISSGTDQSISMQSELSEVSENSSEQESEKILNIESPAKRQKFPRKGLSTITEREYSFASSLNVSQAIDESSFSAEEEEPTVCLVANDCPFILLSTKQILSEYFNIVHTAEDGQQAVQMVECRPVSFYSAILLDYNMPIMNGVEAATLIKIYLQSGRNPEFASNQPPVSHIPHLYAVTQESEQRVLDSIRDVGFKEIMSIITGTDIKKIMEDAGLEFKTVVSPKGGQQWVGPKYEDQVFDPESGGFASRENEQLL